MNARKFCHGGCGLRAAGFCCLMTLNGLAAPEISSRQWVSLDNDWRFTKGDPTNSDAPALLYDVRPESRGEGQRERPAEAIADAEKLAPATNRVLKRWILPTGNRFIPDPAQRHVRPEGNPAARRPHFKLGRRASNAGSKSDVS
ncbi:MAG TPA: hypothetical protein VFV96_05980 [Verrucomicrobiae bacterium]|nr:hypothetical protein [Verrucomicrobiae bacterium]